MTAELLRCPVCQNRINWEPALEGDPHCGRCGWTAPEGAMDRVTHLRAISLYQPWASLIVEGHKTIETRLHTRFRHLHHQRIAIHAGKKYDQRAWREIEAVHPSQEALNIALPINAHRLTQGAILGTALVHNVGWLSSVHSNLAMIPCGDVKRFGLFLSEIHKLEQPIPAKGAQGAWNWALPEDVTLDELT